jgi:hypothetical protein
MGVEASADRIGSPQHRDTMQLGQVFVEDRRNRKDPFPRSAELPEQL